MKYDWRKLVASPNFRWWAKAVVSFFVCCGVLFFIAYKEGAQKEGVDLAKTLIWPLFIIFLTINFGSYFKAIIVALVLRIEHGAEITLGPLKVGSDTTPSTTKTLSDVKRPEIEVLSLLHTSFYRADITVEKNDGNDWYQFELIVVGERGVVSKISSVIYMLDTYWEPRQHSISNRMTAFKLKELATEDTIVSAKVFIEGKSDPIHLNRYIDLHRRGRRLKPISW